MSEPTSGCLRQKGIVFVLSILLAIAATGWAVTAARQNPAPAPEAAPAITPT